MGKQGKRTLFALFMGKDKERMQEFMRVGVIANTHGIKGEVKVYPTTDDKERFSLLKAVYIDTGEEKLCKKISSVRYFKNMAILKFKGINSINDVEQYKGMDLLIDREDALPLEENEYYIADVIGADVLLTDGKKFGVLKEVLTTGANDVFVVDSIEHGEILLPVIPDCVKEMDIPSKKIVVNIMKGLI